MKPAFLLSSSIPALIMAGAVQAQTAPARALTVLPPPAIDAPGARPVAPAGSVAPARAASAAGAASSAMAIPIPELPGAAPTDARGGTPPTVKVEKHDGKLIEQYYQGGRLYMVRVRPEHGVPYTYFVEKGHKLTRSAGAPPVNPVLYTILEWGGSSDDSQ